MGTRDRSFWNRYREVRQNAYNDLKESGEYDDENPKHRYLKKFDKGRDTRQPKPDPRSKWPPSSDYWD